MQLLSAQTEMAKKRLPGEISTTCGQEVKCGLLGEGGGGKMGIRKKGRKKGKCTVNYLIFVDSHNSTKSTYCILFNY